MARGRRASEDKPTRPSLAFPRAEAEAKIATQIQKGREILEACRRGTRDEETTAAEKDKWTSYNRELLRRLFDNDRLADEYWSAANRVFSEFGREPLWGEPDHRLGRSQAAEEIQAYLNALEDIRGRLELIPEAEGVSKPVDPGRQQFKLGSDIFIVHGHDDGVKNTVARFLEKLGLRPVILHEQPDGGRTLIEKFEQYASVGFAVVLMTPDDVGATASSPDKLCPRARQNVILELGFFMGRLGRGRVRALYTEGVEMPSDYEGVLYTPLDTGNAWRLRLAGELRNAGFAVDLNRAI
jgi:predicted nucleotide-binding protein